MHKKVLILTPFFPPNLGGAETFAEELVKESEKSCNVGLFAITWPKNHVWHGLPFWKAIFVIPILFFEGLGFFIYNKIDTIVALGLMAGMAGALLKFIFRVRLLIIPLSLYNFKDRPFFSKVAGWVLRQADVIFCESNVSRNDLLYTGVQWRKMELFTHWVDQERFFPIEHYNPHLKVLFVGRPLYEKGKHIIQEVEKQLPEVDFEYIENMRYEDLPRYYQMANILVVPSLYADSPNRVVAEAASCGCVVIVSDKGALPEQVGGFGIIVEPTVYNFRKAINKFDKCRDLLKIHREITIEYAKRFFTERNAQIIMREY